MDADTDTVNGVTTTLEVDTEASLPPECISRLVEGLLLFGRSNLMG